MKPKLAKQLSNIPSIKLLVAFLRTEANRLNTITDIVETDPVKLAVQVQARKQAYKIICKMYEPLDVSVTKDGFDKTEYIA